MTCPKCGHNPSASDPSTPPGVCPACGIAINKWLARQQQTDRNAERAKLELNLKIRPSLTHRLWQLASYTPEQIDPLTFYGRALVYAIFFFWGWHFVFAGIDWQVIGGSFLHNINLAFHEAGHVIFAPFGRFMAILGGSLFQVLLPLLLVGVFLYPGHSAFLGDTDTRSRRDSFAASIMLWWAGQSCIDVSPYIADAQSRAIPLIRGLGEEYHDWGNLLSMSGILDAALPLAKGCFSAGVLLMIASFIWGGLLLNKQRRRLQ